MLVCVGVVSICSPVACPGGVLGTCPSVSASDLGMCECASDREGLCVATAESPVAVRRRTD